MKTRRATNRILVFLCIFVSCSGQNGKNNEVQSIDIESNIKNLREVYLSEYNAEIHYLTLKKENDLLLTRISNIDITNNLILVSDNDYCLFYDLKGSLIAKIGNKGRGPAEYMSITNIGYDGDSSIYIQSSTDLIEYRTDGSYKGRENLNKQNDPYFLRYSWILLNDSLFLGQIPNLSGHEDYKANIYNKYGEIKNRFKNYIFLNRKTLIINTDDISASFCRFNNKIFFKEKMNDTLFLLSEKYILEPVYVFNIGKYSKPKSFREKTDPIGGNPFEYIFVNSIFKTLDYLFIDCSFGKYTPAKRLTPKEVNGQESWYNTSSVLGIFNTKTDNLIFCRPTSSDNPLFTTGLFNDIDGGPRFLPKKQVNDSTMVMWIEAKQLKDHVASADFKNTIPKDSEKKKELEELANNLSIFDNPVLMFVTFKK